MKFDIVTDQWDNLDSEIVSLQEAQFMFPDYSRALGHMIPGQRIRLSLYTVGYCVLDTETKRFHEL